MVIYCTLFNSSQASVEHVMSVVVMTNEKFREGVPPWEVNFKTMDFDPSQLQYCP